MRRGKLIDLIMSLAIVALVLLALLASPVIGSSSNGMAGASLSLDREVGQAVWSGPLFDLLVGLAIGASVAAMLRLYQRFAAVSRSAS